MPCLKILTNIPKSQIPRDFVDKIIPLLAKILRKPENKFTCVISGDCYISFAGESKSPGATATLESIGNLGPNENRVIVKELSDFIEKEIGVHRDSFPKDPYRRQIWIKACGDHITWVPKRTSTLCSEHFD